MGARNLDLPQVPAKLAVDLTNDSDRPHYIRGKFEHGRFTPIGRQESHALFGLSLSNTLLRIAVGSAIVVCGVYGVVAYSVAQRTKELGIRVALGARSGDLVRLILLRGLAIAIVGSVIGLIGAAALGRVISSLLYEVSATDPLTLALVTVLMILTAGLAGYLPARRAATVDPVSALRSE